MPMLEGATFAQDAGGDTPTGRSMPSTAARSVRSAREMADGIAACSAPAELREWLRRYAIELGCQGGRYVHLGHALTGLGRPSMAGPVRFLSTDTGEDAGSEIDQWPARDPVAPRVRAIFMPFAWSSAAGPEAADAQKSWLHAERDRGIEAGIAVPIQDYFAGPAYLSLFGADAADAARLADERAPELAFIAGHFHVASVKLLAPRDESRADAMLTSRQIECLRLAALGCTAAESGRMLGLSFRGVEFHMHKIVGKLGARTKLTAVVRAVGGGLIDL